MDMITIDSNTHNSKMLSVVWIFALCLMVSVIDIEASTTTTIVTTSSTTTTTTRAEPSSDIPEREAQSCPPLVSPTCPSVTHEVTVPQSDLSFPKQSEALELTIEPAVIKEGVTGQLDITCKFAAGARADGARVASLSIFRTRGEAPNIGKQEVASMNPVAKGNTTSGNMTISRRFNSTGENHVHVSIKSPSERDAGSYKCVAFGADLYKDSFLVHKTVKVAIHGEELSPPPPSTQTSERTMADKPSDQSGRIDGITQQLQKMASSIDDAMHTLEAMEHFKMTLQSRLDNIRDSLFLIVNLPNSRFLLSNYEFTHAKVAQATCELYGGHLAEIDNSAEFKMLDRFLTGVGKHSIDGVLVGGTDEVKEGVWEKRNQNAYVIWGQGSPTNDATKNCIVLLKSDGWKMSDQPCSRTEILTRFLCKVPQKN
ncbi:hypothetical protein Btru_020587 [Bulinus truncatus]|nr:hypothetical protein Btru_020587 [Bulinus truncatus]